METIYIRLMAEGTSVWRPAGAIQNDDGSYTIANALLVPDDELWEFSPGQKVICINHVFSDGSSGLVAYKHG